MINQNEFVKLVATETGFTQKDVKAVLDAEQKIAYAEMAKEEEIKIFNGLTLAGQKKESCVKRNPQTGAEIQVPEKVVPKAKFGVVAKRIVNGEEYDSYDEVLEVGTQITVTLKQEPQMTFIAWVTYQNGEEIILSSELTYTFTVGREYMHISAKGEPVVA